MKNGNSANYFNALRRLDLRGILNTMESIEAYEFLCMHLVAATREVRPDVVRLFFQQVTNRYLLLFTREYTARQSSLVRQ
jgi:hypothetical protein